MTAQPFRAGCPSPARFCLLVCMCLALVGHGCVASAQASHHTSQASPTSATSIAVTPADLFDASHLQAPAPLYATWLAKAGDDPAFASPTLDDSQWTRLDPSTFSLATLFPGRPPILWYRLRVKVAPSQTGMALQVWNLGSAWEVYLNGRLLIRSGSVAPYSPHTLDSLIIQQIPSADLASGSLLIAVRVHITPSQWETSLAPGLYIAKPGTVSIGQDTMANLSIGQLAALRDHAWLTALGLHALPWINDWAGFGLGIVAFALFLSQRRQREYLWIFLQFLVLALAWPISVYRIFHSLNPAWAVAQNLLQAASFVFTILMYFAFMRQPMGRWLRLVFVLGTVFIVASDSIAAYQTSAPVPLIFGELPIIFLLCAYIPFRLILLWRRGDSEAGILLIPALLFSLSYDLAVLLFVLGLFPSFRVFVYHGQLALMFGHIGPFQITLASVALSFFILSLAIIMVVRSTRTSRQQALMESELAAAREVQQVILPDQIESIPGFSIESVYKPAQQVGGDFFQILPDGQGGLVLVVGDVAGKGLPAAMLVSVLVGAIRTAASYSANPATILVQLNQRLVGRTSGGFSTALAAHITAGGSVTLANAGHLPPYLDGREVALPGALPLGIQPGITYDTVTLQLHPGSRLTLYSDGVLEARNTTGELFGFERTAAISTQSAEEIARAAQSFGQEDDITVVAIARSAALETVPA